jgi:hypothetical protein
MDTLTGWLTPVQQRVNERTAYVGYMLALSAYFIALFLPWASVPVVAAGHGGISASGWDEVANISVLPFASVLLNGLPGCRTRKLNIVGLCIMLAFVLLLVNNVEHRSMWLTPLAADAGAMAQYALQGSVLDVGFWIAVAAMISLSVFSLVWTMHVSREAQDRPGQEGAFI